MMQILKVSSGVALVFRWEYEAEIENVIAILEKYVKIISANDENDDRLPLIASAIDDILSHKHTVH